jgi:uncharacterized protein YciI
MKQFAVIVHRTSKWDHSTPPEQQPGFGDHVAYMGGLEKGGAIALAGLMLPSNDVLFVLNAESEAEVRAHFASDPWQRSGVVRLERIEEVALRIANFSPATEHG